MTTLFVLAVALAMDAFAAALGRGAAVRERAGLGEALRVGLVFGTAQALMPLLGWGLGGVFMGAIRDVDHWIAFVLLAFIGARMVRAGLRAEDGAAPANGRAGPWALVPAALATSIDAAAAGVTLPVLAQPVLLACAVIGAVTCALSAAGLLLGAAAGAYAGRRAEAAGGVVLIGIGAKILIEHLYFGG